MNYWLLKTEPDAYSWDDLVRDHQTPWEGVRNYAARNNMKSMKVGDWCFIYHSVKEKQCVGVAEVVKEYYQDPTTEDDRWVVVDISPKFKLKQPISLEMIKTNPNLRDMILVKQSRLSVQPLTQEEFDMIIALSEEDI